ncbi:hypothetical protein ABMY35_04200 [Pseudoalteromonas sp. BZB3]|uniref:hypothetical protein n=1 Tax=Pseudoalteromonas sp. BZB3 TaxID=3136670 RepID=UPI0032C480F4
MQKAIVFTAVLFVLSACGQTDEMNNTEQAKPQSAEKVSSTTEDKPASAPKVTELSNVDKTELGLEKVSQEALNSLRADISAIEKNNECDSNAQCKVIAAGNRACGGPSHYMLYSTKTTTDETAKTVADKLTKYESLYNAQSGMQSICAMLTKPTTQCINNKCVTLNDSTYIAQ